MRKRKVLFIGGMKHGQTMFVPADKHEIYMAFPLPPELQYSPVESESGWGWHITVEEYIMNSTWRNEDKSEIDVFVWEKMRSPDVLAIGKMVRQEYMKTKELTH